jgi:UDP-2,3-diacylglucosamine pyrophosphatase LpxH
LGSDLVHCVRPDAPQRAADGDVRDRQLAAFFDWYRLNRQRGLPWKLVIAGDFVDFVGMSVPPPPAMPTPPNSDELTFGLGGAEDHTIYKLRCVARWHRAVFESLARFAAAGNRIVVVRGNHDVDFHWPSVQDEFVRQLAMHAPIPRGSVEFSPWFYYEEGLVFVEHGHQYDRYCSYENLLSPLSPKDHRRSSRSLSDILLRHVVRPTRGLGESGHENAGVLDYIAFGLRLGIRGTIQLFVRFVTAVATLFAMWREHFSEGARRVRELHERRLAELAARLDMKLESLRALMSLQRPPVTRSAGQIALAVMLDRVFSFVGGAACIVLAFVYAPRWHHALLLSLGIAGLLTLVLVLLSKFRPIDPTAELRDRAARVATLFPAAFVVMGHTHLPEVRTTARGESTYVNLGSWAESVEEPAAAATPSRTHLVVQVGDDGRSTGELMVWDANRGPRRFE